MPADAQRVLRSSEKILRSRADEDPSITTYDFLAEYSRIREEVEAELSDEGSGDFSPEDAEFLRSIGYGLCDDGEVGQAVSQGRAQLNPALDPLSPIRHVVTHREYDRLMKRGLL
jgi:hypothetical protein